jgi:hypothetical protein
MAIFPPQISQAELERLSLLRVGVKHAHDPAGPGDSRLNAASPEALGDPANKKAPVVRPPLAEALSQELRRFAKDEGGFSFIDWAITVSVVSMALGFFMPDLWALFGQVMASVTNDVDGVVFQVKHLR